VEKRKELNNIYL